LVSLNGSAIIYDQIGNPTNYLGTTLLWEKGRQLKQFGSTTFSYDGSGKRIKKNSTVFTYAPNGDLVKQSDGTNPNTLEFIYDGSSVAGFKRNNTHYIYRKNISGDITHILDTSGNIIVEYTYDAWGRHATRARNNSGSLVTSATGTDTTFTNNMALANANPFRYRGYYYDTETQLYFLKTRYYDPAVGRFINADAVSYLDPETINGLNLYAYCGNNPVMRVDPNGTSFTAFLLGLAAAFVFGAAISGGIEIGKQVVTTGGVYSWGQVGLQAIGGGVAAAISYAIPIPGSGFLSYLGTFAVAGASAVAAGLITGTVDSWQSALSTFVIGGTIGVLFRGAGDLFRHWRANRVQLDPRLRDALKQLDKTGPRPGQTEISQSKILDIVSNYDSTKAYSSVAKVGNTRFLVEGHHTTVASTILGKGTGANMGTIVSGLPEVTNVYWVKAWWEFGKTAITVKP